MAADVGNQIVTIRYHRPVDSEVVNKRFKDIRELGIFKGGYLTMTGGDAVSLSPLVCEISDGDHQVRVETTIAVSKTLTEAQPYLILNWEYTGVEDSDFMEINISGNPDVNDIIIAKGAFVASALSSIDYSERTTPDLHHLFLRVEEMETPSSSVRIRSGVGHSASAHTSIIDQVVSLGGYSTNDVVYIYINDTGGIYHSKVASTYAGKALLARIVWPADGILENSDIEDVRTFITPPAIPDGETVIRNSSGKLTVKQGIEYVEIDNIAIVGTPSTGSRLLGNVEHGLGVEPDFVHVQIYNPNSPYQRSPIDCTLAYYSTNLGNVQSNFYWNSTHVYWTLMGKQVGWSDVMFLFDNTWKIRVIAGRYLDN